MRRGALAVACWTALTFVPPVAHAQTSIVTSRGSAARYQRWVATAAVPTPRATIAVEAGLCPGAPSWAAACSLPLEHQIWLTSEGRQRSVFFHELGHVFDWLVMTDGARSRFAALIHRSAEWNWTSTNHNPPVEQFAEAYSMCARHRVIKAVAYGNYDYTPTPARHRRACALIRGAARHPAARPAPAPAVTPTRRPCANRPRSRCTITVRRLERYPDGHAATSVSGLVVRRPTLRESVARPTEAIDDAGLAALTPKALLAPFSLFGG